MKTLFVAGLLTGAILCPAQTATTLYGSLANFDAVNNTGNETYGMEIQLEGVSPQDITYTFGGTYIRYGNPTVVPYVGGVYVRYMSKWDPNTQQFTTSTPVAVNFSPTNGHMCYNGALGTAYLASGCEHFGVSLMRNATSGTYRWLVPDPQTPGSLMTLDPPVSIPAPVWIVIPPARPADPPVVAADIVAPPPPKPEFQFGEAQWMKVYKTEQPREVGLEELLSDNPIVPENAAQVETSWYLLQSKVGGNGKRQQKRNQGALGGNSHSVVRRYEFYTYTGAYDPLTHEALCVDLTCSAPGGNELGDYIGAQMAAANLNVPPPATVNVAATGNGTVTASAGGMKCPGTCSATVSAGTSITLTASAASGSVFAGWSGACNGTDLNCSLTLDADTAVNASFVVARTLSVGRSGKGVVTSNPAGINCGGGGNCSAKFADGGSVTLTATPPAGLQFVNWTGACSGTNPTCTVVMTRDTSVQGNFSK